MKRFLLFIFILFILVPNVRADSIQLMNGTVVEGTIVNRTPFYVRIETTSGVRVREYLMDDIASITQAGSTQEFQEPLVKPVEQPAETQESENPTTNSDTRRATNLSDVKQRDTTSPKTNSENYSPPVHGSFTEVKTVKPSRPQISVSRSYNLKAWSQTGELDKYMKKFSGMFVGIGLLAFLVIYIVVTLPLYLLAKKTDVRPSWLVWIPFLNIHTLCQIGDRPTWWLFLFFLPIPFVIVPILEPLVMLGLVILWIMIWWGIAEKRKRPGWLGILMIIPAVQYIIPWYLALCSVEEPKQKSEKPPTLSSERMGLPPGPKPTPPGGTKTPEVQEPKPGSPIARPPKKPYNA